MDIDYLLMLQSFREETLGGALNGVATFISDFIVDPWMLMFFCIVYWVFSKRDAFFFFATYAMVEFVNALIKLTACVYRPWIKDPRVVPAGDAITQATGYSFPSGHSITAVATYGSIAVWQAKKKRIWIVVICVFMILVTMFSRNFLGVHYPQDVLVGMLHSGILLFINIKLLAWIEKGDAKRDICVFVVGIVLVIAALLYINFKPYPTDYVEGKLLVDPAKMMVDGNAATGMFVGLLVGWFIEKRFIKFEEFKNKKLGLVISIIAVIPIYFWRKNFATVAGPVLGNSAAKFILRFAEYIYALVLIPLLINAINNRTKTPGINSGDFSKKADNGEVVDSDEEQDAKNESLKAASVQAEDSASKDSNGKNTKSDTE